MQTQDTAKREVSQGAQALAELDAASQYSCDGSNAVKCTRTLEKETSMTTLNLRTANYFATSNDNSFGYTPSFALLTDDSNPAITAGVTVVVDVPEAKVIAIRYNETDEDVQFEVPMLDVEPAVIAAAIAYAAKAAIAAIAPDTDTAIDAETVERILEAAYGKVGPAKVVLGHSGCSEASS